MFALLGVIKLHGCKLVPFAALNIVSLVHRLVECELSIVEGLAEVLKQVGVSGDIDDPGPADC